MRYYINAVIREICEITPPDKQVHWLNMQPFRVVYLAILEGISCIETYSMDAAINVMPF